MLFSFSAVKRLPRLVLAAAAVMVLMPAGDAVAQEPPQCLAPNPAAWPRPSRPYFMLVVDTSGSMIGCTNPAVPTGCIGCDGATPPTCCGSYQHKNSCPSTAPPNSCGYEPTRINDAKCALQQTVLAFGGQVNFGLATFPVILSGCSNGACTDSCTAANGSCSPPDGVGTIGEYYKGSGCSVSPFQNWIGTASCGNEPDCNGQPTPSDPPAPPWPQNWNNAGNIVVDMLQDPTWGAPPPASNIPELLKWFDGQCNESKELFAIGATPIAGALRTIHQYYAYGWASGWNDDNYCATGGPVLNHPTPIDSAQDRPCRSLNVILVTDGAYSCGSAPSGAAAGLYNIGATIGGQQVPVRTHVIGFAGVDPADVNPIADAGDDGVLNSSTTALTASNEVELAQALAQIVAGAMQPEVCNNADDNCNGCTDEGYKHYCNTDQTCCSWVTPAQRNTCIQSYLSSIDTDPPDGDRTLLPCTTPAQQSQPADWLCYNPGEICDEIDNNCNGTVDETHSKCGHPPACPVAEVCDGQDNDCNGYIDDGIPCACPNPSPEVCDGCDNDCDGFADEWEDGVTPLPELSCGLPAPPNCVGTRTCNTPAGNPAAGFPVAQPGTCSPLGGYGPCSNNPQPEVCDGLDNDCNIVIDDGIPSAPCKPTLNDPGLYYAGASCTTPLPAGVAGCDPDSQCTLGANACVGGATICQGGSGPSPYGEICDGIDNDCNGIVDDSVWGEGLSCGNNTPPCTPGTTVCVNGAMVCQGGSQPETEVCDGIDNDCNGVPDDGALADAPASLGCWNVPGTCCPVAGLQWCPPAGASCQDLGSLVSAPTSPTSPCHLGTLICVAGNWMCQGANGPTGPEVCDGVDSDCSGVVDDNVPDVGTACGTDVGECVPGQIDCVSGPDPSCGLAAGETALCCVGEVGPVTPEPCDNLDNDCDGIIDNHIDPNDAPTSPPCDLPPYDTAAYPGNRNNPPCQPMSYECDGAGSWICAGGQGPNPEICDGQDNDCDGSIDETGAQPNGVDGTANPSDPSQVIGEECGGGLGLCTPGVWVCENAAFTCQGDVLPQPEVCDCEDNDCDGQSDEPSEPGEPPLCSAGKDCVSVGSNCQCAEECKTEFACPPGFHPEDGINRANGKKDCYCLPNVNNCNGVDCTATTITDGDGNVVCAPAGTDPGDCVLTPECVCQLPNGCQPPCAGVTCDTPGEVCLSFGPSAGSCAEDNCYNTDCPGCNQACHNGLCLDSPCLPDTCAPDQMCKPTADFLSHQCLPSCADQDCGAGQVCRDGECVDSCNPVCTGGQVCDPSTNTCVSNQCTKDSCPNGGCCDPVTGSCGDCPCEGVICPAGQECVDDECEGGSGGGGGSGGSGGTSAGGEGGTKPGKNWLLPTGGGGCHCELAARPAKSYGWTLLLGLGLLLVSRRRRRPSPLFVGVAHGPRRLVVRAV